MGVILLFVIMLLITEMASTYPVWKHFGTKNNFHLSDQHSERKEKQPKSLRTLLLVFFCIVGFGVAAFLIFNALAAKEQTPVAEVRTASEQPVMSPVERRLTDVSAGYDLLFTLQTKWEDGKIYGNNRITFQKLPAPNFSDWLYSLLDKDGFLIKEFHFSSNDFVSETDTAGRTTALLNRFNADMSLKEYQRIDRLQVVVDKRIPLSP